MAKKETLESLKSKAVWYAQRTPSVTTDEKSVYRALVNCWQTTAGPDCGDPLDLELELIIDRILHSVDWNEMREIVCSFDGEFEPVFEDDQDDRDFQNMLYRVLYDHVMHKSERDWLDRED